MVTCKKSIDLSVFIKENERGIRKALINEIKGLATRYIASLYIYKVSCCLLIPYIFSLLQLKC